MTWRSSRGWQADPVTGTSEPSRVLCLWLALAALLVLVVLGIAFVPWDWLPGGELRPVAAEDVFSTAQIERAETYSSMQRRLGWIAIGVSLLVAAGLGLTRAGSGVVRRLPGPWWLRALEATFLVLLIGELATLPMSLARRRNALDYGLTEQGLAGWIRDQGVSLLVTWVFSSIIVLLVIGFARWRPRTWPLWAGIAAAVLTVLGSWVYPLAVEPLFNRFTPLADGSLRAGIFELAEKEQVPISDVLVADASRRTTTLNAWVSGLGNTKRVVLYDNLVSDVPERETLSVVAHELGHTRHGDVLLGTSFAAAGAALGCAVLGLVLSWRGLLDRAGAAGASAPEVVPLMLLLITAGSLLVSPVQNTVSRAMEARADRSAIEATQDPEGFERVQVQLSTRSLSDPTPPAWSQFWFGSHPTALERIGLARAAGE